MTVITEEEPLDVGSAAHVQQNAKKLSKREARDQGDLRVVMSTVEGRRVMHGLLSRCGIFRLSYTPGDPTHTAYLEGHRNVGHALFLTLQAACPALYAQMLTETSQVTDD